MTGFAALPISEQPDSGSQWAGVAKILGPRWAQLPSLTVGLVGVQLMWSVEMSYAMPYLISLGMSKSVTAIVFLAGPISGLVVQPFIGTVADNSKSRFGRRRPYILAGVAVCASAILLLGFTRQFASIVTTTGSSANNSLTIFLAVWAIFCIDFGINAVQAVDRALLVDTLPPPDQPSGNAWAARMLGIGSVTGFFIGNVDMTRVLPFLGNTELQILSAFSSIVLVGTHAVTAYLVKERVLLASSQAKKSLKQELKELWDCARTLPHVIRQICMIQFFAWLGWFPILFDTTLYVGDLYRRSVSANTTMSQEEIDSEATRLGARAQFYSALVALATNFLAPMIIAEVKPRSRRRSSMGGLALGGGIEGKRWWQRKLHLATLWAASHALFAICMVGTFFTSNVTGATVLITLTGFSWAITQWAPFSLLAEAILTTPSEDDPDTGDIRSILLTDSRTHLPLDEDNRRDREPSERDQFLIGHDDDDRSDVESEQSDMVFEAGAIRLGSVKKSRAANGGGVNGHNGHGEDHEHDDWSEVDAEGAEQREGDYHEGLGDEEDTSREGLMGNSAARQSFVDVGGVEDVHSHPPRNRVALDGEERGVETPSALSGKAGIILGIHNIFIVIPQFLITGLSSLIFALLDPSKSVLHAHIPPPSSNTTADATDVATRFVWRQDDGLEDVGGEEATTEGPNAVAIIFRIGGLAAAAAFIISWRLARELRRR